MGDRDDEFRDYVRHKRASLVRTATLLAGNDRHLAEDVVQISLVRLYLAWPRARRLNVDAYVRRIVVNALIDERRRPSARREISTDQPPDVPVFDPLTDTDPTLLGALAQLPARMRAAVVLRHVEGLSVDEAAHALRCSTGNIKSQTARGLDKLRELLASYSSSGEPT